MSDQINELDLVVLLEELPAKGLPRGQVGRVIGEMGSGIYEVEFSDSDGVAFAFLPLRERQIMKLLFDHPADVEYED
ncbi:MAG: DUF4926 domain-containing protein [Bacteroidota bacterium]|nr:DUF4926 domain-containing protein [Bacteroidota bacterium]